MTAYERPKGSGQWRAKFVLGGRQHHVPGSPFPSEEVARAAEDRHRDQLLRRRTEETCASFAERWLEEWPRPAASTRQLYAQAAERFAQEFGQTLLGDVERISARAWALGVPRNISKIIGTLYEDARNVGLVEANPFSNLRLPQTEKTEEVAPPTLEEFRALLNACIVLGGYAPEFRALVTFTAWTGLRASEVMALQWLDVGSMALDIQRARKDDGSYGAPKAGSSGEISFPPPARVLDQVPRRPDDPFVFHTMRGETLKKGSLYYLWNKVRDTSGTSIDRLNAGIPPVRFHDLRHFCATQMLERGASHFDVSVQLRHSDGGALVMARYGHPSRDAARKRLLELWPEPDTTSISATEAANG
jgi:integrase